MKPSYTAIGAEAAEATLRELEAGPWGVKFPALVALWDRVVSFFAFSTFGAPPEQHRQPAQPTAQAHQATRHFPSDDAATQLICLDLRNITADWGRAAQEWRQAMNEYSIAYGDRFSRPAA